MGSAAAAAGLEPALRLAQLVLERRDPLGERLGRLGAGGLGGPLERVEALADERVGARRRSRASMRRIPEPMLRSPVITKPPIWPVARQCVPPHSSKL